MRAVGANRNTHWRRAGARQVAKNADSSRSDDSTPQLAFAFRAGWGGARANAGRKARPRQAVPHRARPLHRQWQPVHVTLRARLAQLRSQFIFPTIRLALTRATRHNPARFRVVHFSVQSNHLHLVVEATDRSALSSGMSGLAIRVARYVNDLLSRRGRFWADRWHGRALKTPREVRNAIVYVLANARKHIRRALPAGVDPYSSALWFDGWREFRADSGVPPPFFETPKWRDHSNDVSTGADFAPRTWLCRTGWRRHGLIAVGEMPLH
jgi:REP element-mobilizing transposase RayT